MKGVVVKTCVVAVLAAFPVVFVSFPAARPADVAEPTVTAVVRAAKEGLEELVPAREPPARSAPAADDPAARTDPPPRATALLLASIADERHYGRSIRLGGLEGGAEALQAEYEVLVGAGRAPGRRKLLVAGLHARPAFLARVTRNDPDPQVRGQALLTRSAWGEPDGELLADLERAFRRRDDPGLGIPVGVAVDAAGNVLHRTRGATGSLRREAVRLLEEIAADGSVPDRDRRSALRTLDR